MFAPNSIKTLMSIKNYNQIDNPKDNLSKPILASTYEKANQKDKIEEKDEDFSPKGCRDISEKVINTRVLIKEIDGKLDDLKKWKRSQKKELERKLAENKRDLEPLSDNGEPSEDQQDSYEQYIQKLEEMMNLYRIDLDEAKMLARSHDSNHNNIIRDIGEKITQREQRIAELSEQLSIHENQKKLNTFEKGLDFISDIQGLKNSLENWKKEFNATLRNKKETELRAFDKENAEENAGNGVLKSFIEKEKQELCKEQKYHFKDDLDDIDKELKELEEMFDTK